jgi:hypothetical protein
MSWRVFSLIAMSLPFPVALHFFWIHWKLYRESGDKDRLISNSDGYGIWEALFFIGLFLVYSIARWGNIVLMFTSLRALPTESYIAIDWLSSIPHI